MLTRLAPAQGFTLIEVLISLTVIGILLALGAPAFYEFLQNQKTRAATEAIVNGVQIARAEAVRRNLGVQFKLTGMPATDWTVSESTAGTVVQTRSSQEGTVGIVVTALDSASNAATTVTFSSLGGLTANADGTTAIAKINVSNSSFTGTNARPLQVMISGGGSIRMCDPAISTATDARYCPTTY